MGAKLTKLLVFRTLVGWELFKNGQVLINKASPHHVGRLVWWVVLVCQKALLKIPWGQYPLAYFFELHFTVGGVLHAEAHFLYLLFVCGNLQVPLQDTRRWVKVGPARLIEANYYVLLLAHRNLVQKF